MFQNRSAEKNTSPKAEKKVTGGRKQLNDEELQIKIKGSSMSGTCSTHEMKK
jgi:hypothetical protein